MAPHNIDQKQVEQEHARCRQATRVADHQSSAMQSGAAGETTSGDGNPGTKYRRSYLYPVAVIAAALILIMMAAV
jgi:hypothetical protein